MLKIYQNIILSKSRQWLKSSPFKVRKINSETFIRLTLKSCCFFYFIIKKFVHLSDCLGVAEFTVSFTDNAPCTVYNPIKRTA